MTEQCRFLRTIRFDGTDEFVFEAAASPDEWAISGAFAFSGLEPAMVTGKTRQAFTNGFLSVETFGRATFVCVAELDLAAREQLELALAQHFVDAYGAPDVAVALPVAQAEFAFVADLVKDVPVNTVFAVKRSFDDDGDIREEFHKIEQQAPDWPIRAAAVSGNASESEDGR